MQYKVELSEQAQADIREIYEYIREHGPADPDDWKATLDRKLTSLETFPDACGFAPENEYTELTVRQLLYAPFRILFETDGMSVYVLTVRHGARLSLSQDEIEKLL